MIERLKTRNRHYKCNRLNGSTKITVLTLNVGGLSKAQTQLMVDCEQKLYCGIRDPNAKPGEKYDWSLCPAFEEYLRRRNGDEKSSG